MHKFFYESSCKAFEWMCEMTPAVLPVPPWTSVPNRPDITHFPRLSQAQTSTGLPTATTTNKKNMLSVGHERLRQRAKAIVDNEKVKSLARKFLGCSNEVYNCQYSYYLASDYHDIDEHLCDAFEIDTANNNICDFPDQNRHLFDLIPEELLNDSMVRALSEAPRRAVTPSFPRALSLDPAPSKVPMSCSRQATKEIDLCDDLDDDLSKETAKTNAAIRSMEKAIECIDLLLQDESDEQIQYETISVLPHPPSRPPPPRPLPRTSSFRSTANRNLNQSLNNRFPMLNNFSAANERSSSAPPARSTLSPLPRR